jgi:hypothetical protein
MKFMAVLLFAFADPHGLRIPVGLDTYLPVPADNPLTKESVLMRYVS